jgi:hypothetical protein
LLWLSGQVALSRLRSAPRCPPPSQNPFANMGNMAGMMEQVKKAQQLMQTEAVKVQAELAACVPPAHPVVWCVWTCMRAAGRAGRYGPVR